MSQALDQLTALPAGRMLYASYSRGWANIFRSKDYPGYWHLYEFLEWANQMQQTTKPVTAEGILMGLELAGLSLDDFTEVSDSGRNEWPLPKLKRGEVALAPLPDFAAMMKGAAC